MARDTLNTFRRERQGVGLCRSHIAESNDKLAACRTFAAAGPQASDL